MSLSPTRFEGDRAGGGRTTANYHDSKEQQVRRYLVAFSHSGGFGSAEVPGPPQISGLADATALAQAIERELHARNVVILNIQPLPIGQ